MLSSQGEFDQNTTLHSPSEYKHTLHPLTSSCSHNKQMQDDDLQHRFSGGIPGSGSGNCGLQETQKKFYYAFRVVFSVGIMWFLISINMGDISKQRRILLNHLSLELRIIKFSGKHSNQCGLGVGASLQHYASVVHIITTPSIS